MVNLKEYIIAGILFSAGAIFGYNYTKDFNQEIGKLQGKLEMKSLIVDYFDKMVDF